MTPPPTIDTLPAKIPIFPLGGALCLPRGSLPLNIFEPRYLDMVRDAMAGDRVIGMVQPESDGALFGVGGLGRITQYNETDDGRFLIVLSGLLRFRIAEELSVTTAYRQVVADYSDYLDDFRTPDPLAPAVRASLEEGLRVFLDGQELSADWDSVSHADDESLVNTLSAVCPFDVAEKQALVEAPTLAARAETLETLLRFGGAGDPGSAAVN